MSDLDARMRLLHHLPWGPRLAALAAAARAADHDERDVLIAELVAGVFARRDRIVRQARRHLLSTWGSLTPPQQQSVLIALGDALPELLAQTIANPLAAPPALRAWTDLLASESVASTLDPLVARQVTHPAALLDLIDASTAHCRAEAPDLAVAARSAIGALAATFPSRQSVALDPHADLLRQSVDAALADVAQHYDDHRDDGILEAIILQTISPGPAIRAWLATRDDVGHMALRRVAKTLRPAAMAAHAAAWLGRPALAGLAERSLTKGGQALWTAVLADWPLLAEPTRAKRIAKLRRLGEGLLSPGSWGDLPEHARRGAIAWTTRAELREHDRRVRLSWHLGDPSARVRHAAVRALAHRPASAELDAAIIDFTHDADECVADAALSALGRARGLGRRRALCDAIAIAQRSAHARVRSRARHLRPVFDAFAWPATSGARWHTPAAARTLLAREPDLFVEELKARLLEPTGETRRCALWLTQRLDLADDLVEELVAIALGVAQRATVQERAKAMLLLGNVTSEHVARASSVLAHGLSDTDGRIRADAVEAVGRLRGRDAPLHAFFHDDIPRVRGNALRHGVLVEAQPAAIQELRAMLQDQRMPHRRSALWVVERARPIELAALVADLAQREPEPILRARAVRCARRLLATMDREVAA